MATPPVQNLDVWKGNTFTLPLAFTTTSGTFDLTGAELVFKAVSGNVTIRKSTADAGSGFVIIAPVTGLAQLDLTVAETRSLPNGQVRYEVEYRLGSTQKTLLYGVMNVTEWVNDD